MLAKVPWQSVNRAIEPDERRHAGMILRQPRLFDLRFELERVREIATGKQMGETIDNAWRNMGRFANVACRAPSAVNDHVRRHRGPVLPVEAMNSLTHSVAPVAE